MGSETTVKLSPTDEFNEQINGDKNVEQKLKW